MPASPARYDKLIKILPQHKSATKAIEEAGFSRHTARTQQKRVLQSALKHQAREILNAPTDGSIKTKVLMSDIVGISKQELMNSLKYIATQQRDLASALKVLGALSKEHNVTLQADEAQSVTVPILNVVVEKQNTEPDTQQVETIETTPLIE